MKVEFLNPEFVELILCCDACDQVFLTVGIGISSLTPGLFSQTLAELGQAGLQARRQHTFTHFGSVTIHERRRGEPTNNRYPLG